MTNDALESRLRAYGEILDRAAAQHDEDTVPVVSDARRRANRRTLVALATAAAVTVGALGVVGVVGSGGDGTQVRSSSGRVPLQRGADGSFPLLLIDGWEVTRADEQNRPLSSADPDGPRYRSAEATFTRGRSQVTLHQYAGDTSMRDGYLDDRADSGKQRQRTVLGYPASVTDYRGNNQMSAIWFVDEVVYELMLEIGSGDDFFDALDALRVVDPDTWEAALPESSVAPRERAAEVDRMLAGIPQPPGFDPAPLRQGTVAVGRYQLGVQVAGPVTCAWVSQWSATRHAGDRAAEQQAADAMRTAPEWPLLKEMKTEGDWPEGVWQLARSIAAGDSKVYQYSVEEYAAMAADCR